MTRRISHASSSSSSSSSPRQPLRFMDIVQVINLVLLSLLLYNFSQFQPPNIQDYQPTSNHPATTTSTGSSTRPKQDWVAVASKKQLSPWESNPPKATVLMDTKEDFVKHRHECIQSVRNKHQQIFQPLLQRTNRKEDVEVLLVDPAYHSNVGDHMLTLGELKLLQTIRPNQTPKQCHYVQANNFYESCTDVVRASDRTAKTTTKVALWHAGGNWGDLWRDAQDVRIPSLKTILENGYSVIGLPQSLYYLDESLKKKDAIDIKEKVALGLGLAEENQGESEPSKAEEPNDDYQWLATPSKKPIDTKALDTKEGLALAKEKVIFMWREKESFEEASQLYPFVTNMLVPDMAFQLGPYAPIRKHPNKMVDIILFLRRDHESKVTSESNQDSIRRMLPRKDLTYRIVDWKDRLDIFDTTDIFFTDTAIELLSLGKVVVCDRLHAAMLAYLSAIPFVYIDQVSGKVTKTLRAAFGDKEDCLDEEKSRWAQATTLREALVKAVDMIDHPSSPHGQTSFLRTLVST